MNSEKLLRQYVDTGIGIGENQFNKLSDNLKKTYLRKRFIAIMDADSYMESFELRSFSEEQINKLKKYPRFVNYFYGLDKEEILNNFYQTFDNDSSIKDIQILIRDTEIGPKLEAVTDKVFKVFGKKINFYDIVADIMTRYDDLDLKMGIAYKYIDVIEGELTSRNVTEMSYLRDTYRYYICNKLINDYSPDKWSRYISILFRNMSDEYMVPILKTIIKKGTDIGSTTLPYALRNIKDDNAIIEILDGYFKLPDTTSFNFRNLHYFAGDRLRPMYLQILEMFLKYHNEKLHRYDIDRLIENCPENIWYEANQMIGKYVPFIQINENINRIKDLLK